MDGSTHLTSKGMAIGLDDAYSYPYLVWLLHSLPHLNTTFHTVNNSFAPDSATYLESLGILASIPATWLIFTLFILLIYLLTRCCDRKPRPSKSISTLKVTLAVTSVLCCAAVGLGLYGNDDLHNGIMETLQQGQQVNMLVAKIRNQTEAIERQLKELAGNDLREIHKVFDDNVASNLTIFKKAEYHFSLLSGNNTMAANAAADIRMPLLGLNLMPRIRQGERFEYVRWSMTMTVLSVLLVLCVILLVGVARHNRSALIAFSVCGLLAVIASYLMASLYLASSVALSDLCVDPSKFIESQANTDLAKEIIKYYTSCERARANPFTQRLREAKTTLENMRQNLIAIKPLAFQLFPKKGLEQKFNSLKNEINAADTISTSLTTLVDCRALHTHYLRGSRALCSIGLMGLTLMLGSAVLAGLLLTALVWVDSHTWIYIRNKKEYHQVTESDPYLPPPAASQAIAARTLQRSQGQLAPPDTPPPSYTSALLQKAAPDAPSAPHEARPLLDGCDMRSTEYYRGAPMSHIRGHTLGRLPSHQHDTLAGPNNGKYATLSKQCKTLESSDFY